MDFPNIAFTKETWHPLPKVDKDKVIKAVMVYLVAIDEKKHPLQNDKRQGSICGERLRLENFVKEVIVWEHCMVQQPQAQAFA
jgi:hypothetical protein